MVKPELTVLTNLILESPKILRIKAQVKFQDNQVILYYKRIQKQHYTS